MRVFSRWLLALTLAACVTDPTPNGLEGTSRVQHLVLPVKQAGQLDLLLVIDNSPAMASNREHIRGQIPSFVQALETMQGGLPSLHLGVVTTDVGGCGRGDGDAGRMRTSARVEGAFISDLRYESRTRIRNYTGELVDVVAELADVGSEGCVYTRPLDAIRLALDHSANADFLRPNALLLVVVITATDDCSFTDAFTPKPTTNPAIAAAHCHVYREDLVDLESAAADLRARHADPSRVAISVVSGLDGPPALIVRDGALQVAPSCSDESASATAAPRLHAFRRMFPARSGFTSICQPYLSDVLSVLAGLPDRFFPDPCFAAPLLDLAPELDGIQADCSAAYQFPDGTQRLIPACGGGAGLDSGERARCWSIQRSDLFCPGLELYFDVTPLTEPVPSGTAVVADCVSE